MSEPPLYARQAEPMLAEALTDSPVVLVHGPRQCGKTTLVGMLGEKCGFDYVSFDHEVARGAAEADPVEGAPP